MEDSTRGLGHPKAFFLLSKQKCLKLVMLTNDTSMASALAGLKEHCPGSLHSAIPFAGIDVSSFQKFPNAPHLETAFGLRLTQGQAKGQGWKVVSSFA